MVQAKFTHAGISMFEPRDDVIPESESECHRPQQDHGCAIGLTEANQGLTTRALEAHYLAGGNVPNVVRALIASHRAGIDMDWQVAQAIDLAGRDVLEAVRTSVYPKVIDCPDPKKTSGALDAVAGDGVQLKARARVTVRTNIHQLIGGATEETVIARVGQGSCRRSGRRLPTRSCWKTRTDLADRAGTGTRSANGV